MSRRNKPLEKKARTMERAIRKGRIHAFVNLVHWLEDQGHADTTGQAVKLIKAGRVKSESHILDGDQVFEREVFDEESGKLGMKKFRAFSPIYPAVLRANLQFVES